jgi:hypothetical protein
MKIMKIISNFFKKRAKLKTFQKSEARLSKWIYQVLTSKTNKSCVIIVHPKEHIVFKRAMMKGCDLFIKKVVNGGDVIDLTNGKRIYVITRPQRYGGLMGANMDYSFITAAASADPTLNLLMMELTILNKIKTL